MLMIYHIVGLYASKNVESRRKNAWGFGAYP